MTKSSEVNVAGPISFLRRSVSVRSTERVQYGQVVAVDYDSLTVVSDQQQIQAHVTEVSPVPPIVALLLQHVEFHCSDWSDSEIEALQTTILNRVLGEDGEEASNDIATILEGTLSEETIPSPSKICRWVDPKTGEDAVFELQHAVDFAYFVDGGHQPVPGYLGSSFCQPSRQPTPSRSDRAELDAAEIFDPFSDDDESPQDLFEPQVHGPASVAASQQRSNKRAQESSFIGDDDQLVVERVQRRRVEPHSALDKDALIVERLGDDPGLLERFLEVRRAHSNHQAASTGKVFADADTAKIAVPSAAAKKKLEAPSKYAFTPRPDQQQVHDRITSAKHKGKTPSVYVNGMVRSDAVKFKSLPGVCIRAFDIRFGSKGLSIRHFARISQDERMAWLESGGSNFDNLSATAEFEKATPATCIEDVVDSTRVFLTYTREYCCQELIELTEKIVEFIEQTLMRVSWSLKELPSVVYWINDVLEDFREAAETNSDLRQVQSRCSTEDRVLRDLMFVKVHRQVDEVRAASASSGGSAPNPRSGSGHRLQMVACEKKGFGRIPKNVLNRMPVQVDPASGGSRPLCMRYLSNAGCTEDDSGCPSNRGHFVPKQLPAVVKAEIAKRFGGLKLEFKQL
ncbi:hypothetical protein PF010_g1479 [Phytophthora fragariae]|uniref:Uncharacterized protein n=1 Tax=Phytophthora fragariae TaxID=53985 RepID=A0A6G0LZU1_9STRA|nr:hypothetical protein PF010_g1479 [Phytophthora fragariae]